MIQKERKRQIEKEYIIFQGRNVSTNTDRIDYGWVFPEQSHASDLKTNWISIKDSQDWERNLESHSVSKQVDSQSHSGSSSISVRQCSPPSPSMFQGTESLSPWSLYGQTANGWVDPLLVLSVPRGQPHYCSPEEATGWTVSAKWGDHDATWAKEKEDWKLICSIGRMRLLDAVKWSENILKNYSVGGRKMMCSVLNRLGLRRQWHIQRWL